MGKYLSSLRLKLLGKRVVGVAVRGAGLSAVVEGVPVVGRQLDRVLDPGGQVGVGNYRRRRVKNRQANVMSRQNCTKLTERPADGNNVTGPLDV